VYWSYLIAASMTIGIYWWRRRPASRFGPLLITFGVLVWIVTWQLANAPLAFDIGVLAEAPVFVLTIYLFLAFPMGRVEPPAARWLMAVLVFGVLAFFLPWALFTPVIAGGGPLTTCAPGCPDNVLQIATAPDVVRIAGTAETYAVIGVTLAVLFVYAYRVRAASRPQRRALLAVAVTSLLFLPAFLVSNVARQILELDPATLYDLSWGIVVTRVLLPLGFLIALLQADRFAGSALRTMLERLARRPTPQAWRDTVAEALDDASLRLGYREPATGGFLEPDGTALEAPPPGRTWVPIDRADEPVAVMVIDETLAEDPELVRAAATATLVAVENGALEGELRRQIQRDIHDSAQQRLLALRIHLTLAGEQAGSSQDRELLERLDAEVEQAIDELRRVTHRGAPRDGLGPALELAAASMPLAVAVRMDGLGRLPEAFETTIYFCVLEGLQNAVKHAGPEASVTIDVGRRDGAVTFTVSDDGVGFEPDAVKAGEGLANIGHRLDTAGGTLEIDSRPGEGTRITGVLHA
jgi:signal transduction histidine kinase